MKSPNRSSSKSWSALALSIAVATSGCGRVDDRQSVGQQSQALLGPMTFESSCNSGDVPNIALAFRYARIAANSPAFAECIRLTFSQNMVLDENLQYTDGPYIPCAKDPPTPTADVILASATTPNPTDFACDYNPDLGSTAAYSSVGGVSANDPTAIEKITMARELSKFQNTSGPCYLGYGGNCISDSTYGEAAAIIYHEVMHTHGYDHMEFKDPPYLCGIDPSLNPQYANSVPYMVTGCLQFTLQHSAQFCPMHQGCGSGLNLQQSVFAATGDCACVADPIPGDSSLECAQPCNGVCCGDGQVCQANACVSCGGPNQPCCAGSGTACETGLSCNASQICTCGGTGQSCGSNSDCCSSECLSGQCYCATAGAHCFSNADCCSQSCDRGTCACVPQGGACSGVVCCGDNVCTSGVCAPPTPPNTCNGVKRPTGTCRAGWRCCEDGWNCGLCQ